MVVAQLELEVFRPRPGVAVVQCKGEHDLATREELGALFAELVAENELVVVDVTESHFIDTSFLHNLAAADDAARARGCRLRLQVGTVRIVQRALELSGILNVVEHMSTREEALA